TLMKWDNRAEAIALEEKNSNGKRDLAPGEFNAITALVTRAFKVSKDGGLAGKTLAQLNQHALAACIALIPRDGKVLEVDKFTALKEGE
ncbi:aspartate-alanine antiporter, partial [Vibrio sp. Vb2880]|nr:aspartate-alanine antiporter [Vibrio sp. Vb2880]